MRLCFVFFFFKQKTAYEMRISDWSSDVCSSDLRDLRQRQRRRLGWGKPARKAPSRSSQRPSCHAAALTPDGTHHGHMLVHTYAYEIGPPACKDRDRQSVV